jgi:5-methylcytosine-specific restriction endonuclease McrA
MKEISNKGNRKIARKLKFSTSQFDRNIRKEIFKRDKYTCQMCGAIPDQIPKDYNGRYTINGVKVKRNKSKVYGLVTCLVLDHIIPWKKGGTIESKNLQVLCDPCNCSKGDRLLYKKVINSEMV